jgi:protein ERP2
MHTCVHLQVIEGGDLDVNFVVSDPDRVAMVMEPRSMDGLHGLEVKKTGEYEICLDNSFSSFTGKLL